jgi:DUF1680 family protein
MKRKEFLINTSAGIAISFIAPTSLLVRNKDVEINKNHPNIWPGKGPWFGPMGKERNARFTPVGYQSREFEHNNIFRYSKEAISIKVDLGSSRKIDKIKLFPVVGWAEETSIGFPKRFRIDVSNHKNFKTSKIVADHTNKDYKDPNDLVQIFDGNRIRARYVRLSVTKLRDHKLLLSKLEAWSGGKDVAEGCPVLATNEGRDNAPFYLFESSLTRKPRGQGEGVITNNPDNVIPADQWDLVNYKAHAPLKGVTLDKGLFKDTMLNNIDYLLNIPIDSEGFLLRPFRERAGKPVSSKLPPPDPFWNTKLPGSGAGRFLMGAGHTLQWMEHPKLRKRVNKVIDGIEACSEKDGSIMAFAENTMFFRERGAYTRAWLTRGLRAAGFGGNKKAFKLLRKYYDWFDKCKYLPELLRRAGQGVQGMIANTLTYFSPAGKPKDLQVIQQYFQENYWLDELAARDPKAIWKYPYDHPHNYLLTSIVPYFDLYRATGKQKYLDAAQGGWELFHENWIHIGGSVAICEGNKYPPKSYYLHQHTGELCGSSFWIRLSQRFHRLYPEQEKYVNEIEKSIYNVAMANQFKGKGIRYHANLVGKKEEPTAKNTCCEGQGTRTFGSLPEWIYSIADDGLYVNLFAASKIDWKQNNRDVQLHMKTDFPFDRDVAIHISLPESIKFNLRIRIPRWSSDDMPIRINGQAVTNGEPATFASLDRKWSDGDEISFSLPADFRVIRYQGMDAINQTRDHYALLYGPILMALVGNKVDKEGHAAIKLSPQDMVKRLKPQNKPLHFGIAGNDHSKYIPYYQVEKQNFTCFPRINKKL